MDKVHMLMLLINAILILNSKDIIHELFFLVNSCMLLEFLSRKTKEE